MLNNNKQKRLELEMFFFLKIYLSPNVKNNGQTIENIFFRLINSIKYITLF